jgi:hypothetical protein
MRIHFGKRNAGSTLALVLFMVGLMGLSLASYLVLVKNQNLSVMRSLAWNSCIPMAEAGIEEALTQINDSGISHLNSCGWVTSSGGYTKTRYLGDSYYVTTISATDPPVIQSQGYVPLPWNPAGASACLAWVGITQPSSTFCSRTVVVTTTNNSPWTKAMVAKGSINLNGNNITTDSFDSGNPNYSTKGLYDPAKRRDHGDVATDSTIVDSLSVGNADLWGRASTGPGGSVTIGPNGSVGDLAWHQSHSGIEPGWTNNDMNVAFPEVTVPFTSGFTPQSGTLGKNTYTYLLDGGSSGADYSITDLTLSGKQSMFVTNKVRLLVTGTLSVSGNASIEVATNSSLKIYVQGANASLGGNGVANDTGNATNFFYFGLPTNTSLSFSGNAAFTGVIYAPDARFSLGGGGNNTLDFIGASVSSTVSMNGHFNFHYDESLGRLNLSSVYKITSWNEL